MERLFTPQTAPAPKSFSCHPPPDSDLGGMALAALDIARATAQILAVAVLLHDYRSDYFSVHMVIFSNREERADTDALSWGHQHHYPLPATASAQASGPHAIHSMDQPPLERRPPCALDGACDLVP